MSEQRKPLLSDEALSKYAVTPNGLAGANKYAMGRAIRDFYENLITEGRLRAVIEAHPVHKLSGLLCSHCSILWHDDEFCRGCGNPTVKKR